MRRSMCARVRERMCVCVQAQASFFTQTLQRSQRVWSAHGPHPPRILLIGGRQRRRGQQAGKVGRAARERPSTQRRGRVRL